MNRNEKIIELLKDNGFGKRSNNDVYYKTVEINTYFKRKLADIEIAAYVALDEEDMEYSDVDFNIECQIDADLSEALQISEELNDTLSEIDELKYDIEHCKGDEN